MSCAPIGSACVNCLLFPSSWSGTWCMQHTSHCDELGDSPIIPNRLCEWEMSSESSKEGPIFVESTGGDILEKESKELEDQPSSLDLMHVSILSS